jgi:hypothetical protein
MRIVDLTLAEAADSAVMKNVAEFLLTGSHTAIYTPSPAPRVISPADVPDAGLPPLPGAPTSAAHAPAAPVSLPSVPQVPAAGGIDPATIGFGAGNTSAGTTMGQLQAQQLQSSVVPAIPAAPAVAAAPTAPALPSAPVGVIVDKDGFPWNPKIHATTKAQNKDGTWRKRQGVDAALIASEEAAMRQVMAIPAPAQQLALAPAPAVPILPAPPATPEAALAQSLGADPFLTIPDTDKFKVWMEELTPAMTKGVITPQFMAKYLTEPLGTYAMRPDLVAQARQAVRDGLRAEFPADAY